MAVGRKRKTNKELPRRVYIKSGTYWFVDASNKWHKLGRTKTEMYQALAILLGDSPNTLLHHIERYEREIMPTKAISTRKSQSGQLKRLKAVFGNMAPETVTTIDIAGFLDRYPSPVNANRHIALLSHIYTKLIRWGVVESNPCLGVERNKEHARTRYVEDDEFWAVWAKMPRHIQLLMELALCTGQRQGDLVSLKWSQVTDDGVHFQQSKTGRRLIVTWTPALEDVIKRCRKGVSGIWVVRKPDGQPFKPSGIQTAWQRFMSTYDGERFTFHDIRAKSASDHETGAHLGHTSEATLRRIYRRKPEVVKGL